jgi:predicted dehydrogenase
MSTTAKGKIRVGIIGIGNWGRYLYAAFANDREKGTHSAPTFADAVKMHKLIDLISDASASGARKTVTF